MNSPFSSTPISTPATARPAISPSGALILLASWPAAILIGVAYHFLALGLDLWLLFPLLVGALIGGVVVLLLRATKIWSRPWVIFVALIAGFLGYGARLLADSEADRQQSLAYFARQMAKTPAAQSALEAKLKANYPPLRYFPLYLQSQAENGIVLGDVVESSSSKVKHAPIRGIGFWVLVALDGALMAGTATAVVWNALHTPFCPTCDRWFGAHASVSKLGLGQSESAMQMGREGKWRALGELVPEKAKNDQCCEIKVAACPQCRAGDAIFQTVKGNQKRVKLHLPLSGENVEALKAGRAARL